MAKRALDIGNCGPDHGAIANMIRTNFGAEADHANAADDAWPLLEKNDYDLVMVNRHLDLDGSSGMHVIGQVQEKYANLPMMLITNFAEHQDAAVAAGAVRGFGKNTIGSAATIELLSNYLS